MTMHPVVYVAFGILLVELVLLAVFGKEIPGGDQ